MNNKLCIFLLIIISFNYSFADYMAKIVLQSDGASSHVGSLPAGSIKFDTETGGGGGNLPLDPSEDPEAIVCTYSNGGSGYNGYGYHYVQEGSTVWFQDNYVGSSPTGIYSQGALMESFDYGYAIVNYYEICVSNKHLDTFKLKEETSAGVEGILLSLDGLNFEKIKNGNITVSPTVNNFTLYFANSTNSDSSFSFSDAEHQWLSGGYNYNCVLKSYPGALSPGQVREVNGALSLGSCNITTPGTLRIYYTTSTGEQAEFILNVSQ